MTEREKVIKGLEFTKAMITFNPSTGEDIEPGNLNEADKTSYDACVGAIALLKEQDEQIKLLEHQAVDNKGKFNAHETLIGKALDAGHIYR